VLGLEEADRLFKALSEVSLYLLREGREIFRNPLYDEVKHLVDQEWVRSLVKAPMYSYVVDRLGPDVLQPYVRQVVRLLRGVRPVFEHGLRARQDERGEGRGAPSASRAASAMPGR
jgi:hypothetical protein